MWIRIHRPRGGGKHRPQGYDRRMLEDANARLSITPATCARDARKLGSGGGQHEGKRRAMRSRPLARVVPGKTARVRRKTRSATPRGTSPSSFPQSACLPLLTDVRVEQRDDLVRLRFILGSDRLENARLAVRQRRPAEASSRQGGMPASEEGDSRAKGTMAHNRRLFEGMGRQNAVALPPPPRIHLSPASVGSPTPEPARSTWLPRDRAPRSVRLSFSAAHVGPVHFTVWSCSVRLGASVKSYPPQLTSFTSGQVRSGRVRSDQATQTDDGPLQEHEESPSETPLRTCTA